MHPKEEAMNTAYFKKLFEYDHWANERALKALEATPSVEEAALQKMSHLLQAKAMWLSRLDPASPPPDSLSGILPLAQGRRLNEELKVRLEAYLSRQEDGQLSRRIAYHNTKGTAFETPLSDILTQLGTHGAYHRGQIATLVKRSGGVPPETDYILFARLQG